MNAARNAAHRITACAWHESHAEHTLDCDVATPLIAAAIQAAEAAERERCIEAIREACGMCGGKGYTETSHAAHGCGGDESMCASGCPVEQIEQEECEYCGRPIDAIRSAPPSTPEAD